MSDTPNTPDSSKLIQPLPTNEGDTQAPASEESTNQAASPAYDPRLERIETILETVVNLLENITQTQNALAQNQNALIQGQISLTGALTKIAQTLSEVRAGQERQDRVSDFLMGVDQDTNRQHIKE